MNFFVAAGSSFKIFAANYVSAPNGFPNSLFTPGSTFTVTVTLGDGSTGMADVTIPTPLDFDGDGKADLIWYTASTGTTAVWLMNGTSISSAAVLLTAPSSEVTGY